MDVANRLKCDKYMDINVIKKQDMNKKLKCVILCRCIIKYRV